MAPTLPDFQGLKHCIQYLASHTHKPIFYPTNSYDGSNVIRLIWSEDYTTQNCLEYQQYTYHTRIRGPVQALFLECFLCLSVNIFKPCEDLIFKSTIVEDELTYGKKHQRQTRTCFKPLPDLHRWNCFPTMVLNIFYIKY